MPGGYWVDRDLITTAWRLFWRGVQALDRGRAHTAESLCSDPGWADRGRGERLKLGRCFKYFAIHHVLPITLANPGKKGKRKYRIGEDVMSASTVH